MKKQLRFIKNIGLIIASIILAFIGGTIINMIGSRYIIEGSIGDFINQLILGGLLPFLSMSILGSRFKVEENIYHKIIFIFFIIFFVGVFVFKILSGYIPEMENILFGLIESIVPIGISTYIFVKHGR